MNTRPNRNIGAMDVEDWQSVYEVIKNFSSKVTYYARDKCIKTVKPVNGAKK